MDYKVYNWINALAHPLIVVHGMFAHICWEIRAVSKKTDTNWNSSTFCGTVPQFAEHLPKKVEQLPKKRGTGPVRP